MIAETIAVGSELLVGGRSDSNSLFITEELGKLGIEVRFKSVVGDDQSDMVKVLKTAVDRAQVVVITGGLGPTVDDCTRQALAKAAGRRLARRKEAFESLKARLAQWGRVPNKGQLRQALIPSGATVLENPIGSAPGFWLNWKQALVIALPGVPRELEAMMREGVVPHLSSRLDTHGRFRRQPITRMLFHTWGLPEADVDAKLAGVMPKGAPIDLGLLASPMGILVSLTSTPRADVREGLMQSLADEVRSRLREWLFAEGLVTMEEVVGGLLTEEKRTIALAESCTGGLISHRLTQVPGSSAYFDRSVICYSNKAKIELLGVPAELIEKYGAVSAEVAAAMAKGICERSDVSVGLSVTGIAGPGGATMAKPVGLVYVGLHSDDGESMTKEHHFHGDRSSNNDRRKPRSIFCVVGSCTRP